MTGRDMEERWKKNHAVVGRGKCISLVSVEYTDGTCFLELMRDSGVFDWNSVATR